MDVSLWVLVAVCLAGSAADTADSGSVPTDADGDGHLTPEDCDDADPRVHPGAVERAGQGDRDCDGQHACWPDDDGDGWAGETWRIQPVSEPCLADLQTQPLDCDDDDATAWPGAVEVCDGDDEDCDGIPDGRGLPGARERFSDRDGDGWGGASLWVCGSPEGTVSRSGDCDDRRALMFPGRVEECDGLDNDCDGAQDEPPLVNGFPWYQDADQDGYADPTVQGTSCDQVPPPGRVAVGWPTDCDDQDATVGVCRDCGCAGTSGGAGWLLALCGARALRRRAIREGLGGHPDRQRA